MTKQYVFSEPGPVDFDRYGHTGKFLGTHSDKTGHLIIETKTGITKSLVEHECEFNYFVIEGVGEFIIGGDTHACRMGDLVVIPPGTTFTFNGNLKMLLINTPTYTPEQNEELPKDAASRRTS